MQHPLLPSVTQRITPTQRGSSTSQKIDTRAKGNTGVIAAGQADIMSYLIQH